MNFLNPVFLFGLLAAALPIVIHLFTRRRPREVPFPSLDFLTEVNQSEIRRLKIKQWLLLALRTLAVAAIALAMSRPAMKGRAGGNGGAASTAIVLVDQSGSMGAAGARGALIDEAKRVVEDLLATLGPVDDLLLVPYDRAPHPVSDGPIGDVARLRGATQAIAATAQVTDHVAALAAAARALGDAHALNRELFWISDFQRAGLATADGAPPASFNAPTGPWNAARVYLVPIVPRSRANAALTDALLAPGASGESAGGALSVTGASFGVRAGDLAIEVVDAKGDALGRGFLPLPERGESSALVPLARIPEDGGTAQLPDDALPLDNRRAFASGRAGTLRVVLREDGPPSALRFALEAGSPASGLAVTAVDGARLASGVRDADVLVIGDLERLGPTELQAVLDFYRGGGGVLLAPGLRADATAWNESLLRELGAGTLGASETAAPGAAWRLQRVVAGHAVLAGFPTRPGEPLSSARFQSVRGFRPGAKGRVLLEFDRAHPALIEAPHALVLNAPLDPASSDFAVSGAFLPLLHQAAKVLGRGTAAASLAPGDRYRAPAATGEWRIEDERGREVASSLSAESGATRIVSEPLERPGLYRVLESGKLRGTFAVNPDPRESDLTPLPDAALTAAFPAGRAQILHPGADLARRVREARYGRELWSWFVIAALLLLIAESIVARAGMAGRGAPAARA